MTIPAPDRLIPLTSVSISTVDKPQTEGLQILNIRNRSIEIIDFETVYEMETTTGTFAMDGGITTVSETFTVTIDTTTTRTRTEFTVTTVTRTSTAPTATTYEACQDNNIVDTGDGGYGIGQLQFPTNFTAFRLTVGGHKRTLNFCSACQGAPYCVWSFLDHSNNCTLIISAVDCDANLSYGSSFKSSPDLPPGTGFTVSNGQCGKIETGGRVHSDENTFGM
ncbi:unnamed protein product [Fusarium langsethiae]|nr:unnamed protein product [Fusarium langsethiae]GKU21230.1 unnamed protein product [Fusarium langsethiae]